jgi:uncharacterized protein YraI
MIEISKMIGALQLRQCGKLLLVAWMLLMLTSCGEVDDFPIPTRVELPTGVVSPLPTPSQFPTITPTNSPSPTLSDAELTATYTFTPSPTITDTWTPSDTPMDTLMPTVTPSPTQEGDAQVVGADGANLRRGPSTQFSPPIALLEEGTQLQLVGVSFNLLWYQVRVGEGLQGWVYSDLVDVRRDDLNLPVTWYPTPLPTMILAEIYPVGTPYSNQSGVPFVSERVRQIFQQGQRNGHRPGAFSKVGDSITVSQPFLWGYDLGAYNLGDYQNLQGALGFFAGSFNRLGPSSFGAANASAVLDPMLADNAVCRSNESPLACEFRLHKPSIALIMLGAADVQSTTTYTTFHGSMTQVIEYCIGQGVVPVLMTFASSPSFFPGPADVVNTTIRNLALQYQIPLIDFRAQAMTLPNRGVGEDGFHLTERGDLFIDLRGEQYQWGMTMRNMLTLQVLNSLLQGIPMQ